MLKTLFLAQLLAPGSSLSLLRCFSPVCFSPSVPPHRSKLQCSICLLYPPSLLPLQIDVFLDELYIVHDIYFYGSNISFHKLIYNVLCCLFFSLKEQFSLKSTLEIAERHTEVTFLALFLNHRKCKSNRNSHACV